MGTYINVYSNHNLPHPDDAHETIARLACTLPMTLAVRDYWHSVGPPGFDTDHWETESTSPYHPEAREYEGPGSLYLTVTPAAARIYTGGRWRGFLSIEPLRIVHLAAFRSIARALGATAMALCADTWDDVTETFLENGTFEQCIAQMHSLMGAPQPSLNLIAPEVIAETERGVPMVWFLEQLETDK